MLTALLFATTAHAQSQDIGVWTAVLASPYVTSETRCGSTSMRVGTDHAFSPSCARASAFS